MCILTFFFFFLFLSFFYYLVCARCALIPIELLLTVYEQPFVQQFAAHTMAMAMWHKRWEKHPSASAPIHPNQTQTHIHTKMGYTNKQANGFIPWSLTISFFLLSFSLPLLLHFFFFLFNFTSYLALATTLLVPIFIRLNKLLLYEAMARGHLYTFYHFIYFFW